MLTGLVRAYVDALWIAAHHPQCDTAAVVVASRSFVRRVGDLEPVTLRDRTDFHENLQKA